MPKQRILQKLRDARLAHDKWVRRAKHLVESLPINEDMIPLDSTECAFGKWLYNDGMKCKSLRNLEPLLKNIEKEHTQLHTIYSTIYNIYFVETKRGFISQIFLGGNKNISREKRSIALEKYHELEKVSEKLMIQLQRLERALMMEDFETINQC